MTSKLSLLAVGIQLFLTMALMPSTAPQYLPYVDESDVVFVSNYNTAYRVDRDYVAPYTGYQDDVQSLPRTVFKSGRGRNAGRVTRGTTTDTEMSAGPTFDWVITGYEIIDPQCRNNRCQPVFVAEMSPSRASWDITSTSPRVSISACTAYCYFRTSVRGHTGGAAHRNNCCSSAKGMKMNIQTSPANANRYLDIKVYIRNGYASAATVIAEGGFNTNSINQKHEQAVFVKEFPCNNLANIGTNGQHYQLPQDITSKSGRVWQVSPPKRECGRIKIYFGVEKRPW